VLERHTAILTVEEGTVVNGFGAVVARRIEELRRDHPNVLVEVLGVPDTVIDHGTRAEQLAETGLDAASIAMRCRAAVGAASLAPVRETA
jgi:1-deoxy-D-xylulose-5-phosphate synthase